MINSYALATSILYGKELVAIQLVIDKDFNT